MERILINNNLYLYNMHTNENHKIGLIGGGSWGTALVKILSNNIKHLNWWIREEHILGNIKENRHNPDFLSSIELDLAKLSLTNDISTLIKNSDVIILCVPAVFIKSVLETHKDKLKNKIMVSATKGIIPEYKMTVSGFLNKHYGIDNSDIVVISGPSHAEEIALEKLTYLTVASEKKENAEFTSSILKTRYLKTTLSEDVIGIEYSAVLKNIIAVATGIAIGTGYGDNFQSVMIANAIKEIKHFIDKVSPHKRDINDYVYLGDLLVTTYSKFSRNRIFGNMIGKGYSVKAAQLEMNMVAEGYYAAKSIRDISRDYNIQMPICDAAYNILYENASPYTEMRKLSEKLV